ncbi:MULTISPECIES: hypothetical protein [Bradyrhizobium]|uniref:Uncharacterized protein n=1 Tax=Bradyrhizobium ottawaense TaxID=931866 RepID=A0ABV4G5R5_9BRAD|nr:MULTISPECIES: hypothetical protein [Bradyrhizobium]
MEATGLFVDVDEAILRRVLALSLVGELSIDDPQPWPSRRQARQSRTRPDFLQEREGSWPPKMANVSSVCASENFR